MTLLMLTLACFQEKQNETKSLADGIVIDSNSQVWIFPPTRNRHEYKNTIPKELRKAKSLFLQDQVKEAASELLLQLDNNSENPTIHSMLCASYLRLQDMKQALKACQRTIEIAPTASHYSNLAVVYMAMGQSEEAIHFNQRALALDGVFIPAYRNLSTLQYKAGLLEDASRTLLRFMQIKPFDNYAYIAYANIQIEMGNTIEAEEILRYRISNWENEGVPNPTERLHAEIPMLLSEILIKKRDHKDALFFANMMEENARNSTDMSQDIIVMSWRFRSHILEKEQHPESNKWKEKIESYCKENPIPSCQLKWGY